MMYWICNMMFAFCCQLPNISGWITESAACWISGLQCSERLLHFKIPKNCFHSHWLSICFINLCDKVTCTTVPTYKYHLHYECQYCVFINIFYFCAFICCYLCLNVLSVLDHLSLFLSFSWSLLWSVWASWMLSRNDILKVITCMVTWSCVMWYWLWVTVARCLIWLYNIYSAEEVEDVSLKWHWVIKLMTN